MTSTVGHINNNVITVGW